MPPQHYVHARCFGRGTGSGQTITDGAIPVSRAIPDRVDDASRQASLTTTRALRRMAAICALGLLAFALLDLAGSRAGAQTDDTGGNSTVTTTADAPAQRSPDRIADAERAERQADGDQLEITLDSGEDNSATQSLTIVLLLAVISLVPTMLVLLTSFTRIMIILGLTRNALSLQGIPPNQVLIGLSLFLTMFVMTPVLTEINDDALQPLLDGDISQEEAFDRGMEPLHEFMASHVREDDLALFTGLSGAEPASPDDVALTTLIPAFVISELRAGFIIGFLIFVPFLVVDIVVSSTLMSMGMVMLPPVIISLPFKLLLFVAVDGWALLIETVVTSFGT
jgi:flagellar biosynthesis protein FliP